MSPLKIEMLFHYNGNQAWDYWINNRKFPRALSLEELPPAYADAITDFLFSDLLARNNGGPEFRITPRGKCYAEFLLNAPLPTHKQPEVEWEVVL